MTSEESRCSCTNCGVYVKSRK